MKKIISLRKFFRPVERRPVHRSLFKKSTFAGDKIMTMAKEFNTEGACFPSFHFMANVSHKMQEVLKMVKEGRYFIINRPRQYGKTTTLFLLSNSLEQDPAYLPLNLSFEGIGDKVFEDEKHFCPAFIRLFRQATLYSDKALSDWLHEKTGQVGTLQDLSDFITEFIHRVNKKVVLIIDEVDKSSNNQLFVSFLAMLRNKYLNRFLPQHRTFYSIVLAGVHDVKSLKLKIRPDEEKKLNSPWNIATDFKVDMNLQPDEIIPMLQDYVQERGVDMDVRQMAERLFYFTSGYPFLVSRLCKIFDEDILPKKELKQWTQADLEKAVGKLLYEKNSNFDSLTANLKNNPDLYQITYLLLLESANIPYSPHHPVINLGMLYGIFRTERNGEGGSLRIHNRIYREIIFNYLSVDMQLEVPSVENNTFQGNYLLKNNELDVPKVLLKFQEFMREQYNKRDRDFLERHGKLLFLSFLKPLINGSGHTFNEPQISDEKRLDIAVTFFQHKYTIELKLWRGEKAHQEGLKQLANYLERQRQHAGFLLIFDHSAVKTWDAKWLDEADKKIFAAWV